MLWKLATQCSKKSLSITSGRCKKFNVLLVELNVVTMLKHKKTAHIEVCTGLRKRSDKKMAASRESHGKLLHVILVIGVITAKRDSESNTIKMVTNMKECGLLIKDMVKVLIGEQKRANLDVSILVIGLKTKSMEEVHFFTKMVIDMTVTGLMDYLKEKAV